MDDFICLRTHFIGLEKMIANASILYQDKDSDLQQLLNSAVLHSHAKP